VCVCVCVCNMMYMSEICLNGYVDLRATDRPCEVCVCERETHTQRVCVCACLSVCLCLCVFLISDLYRSFPTKQPYE